jgi:hypothetical protein
MLELKREHEALSAEVGGLRAENGALRARAASAEGASANGDAAARGARERAAAAEAAAADAAARASALALQYAEAQGACEDLRAVRTRRARAKKAAVEGAGGPLWLRSLTLHTLYTTRTPHRRRVSSLPRRQKSGAARQSARARA